MAYRDYYNILGVERDAHQDDIKKAYRRLARRWHPDRNPGDATAEQLFKDVSEAYVTLGSPERRARYDRLGPLYTEDGRPPRPEDMNQAMSTVWNNLFRWRNKPRPGEDLRYTLTISMEDVFSGTSREIHVPRQVICHGCGGSGASSGGQAQCAACQGTGRSQGPRLFRSECFHCKGTGVEITDACKTCSGDGLITVEDSIRVTVPRGVATGQKLKVKDKGNVSRNGGPSGDLYVIVNVSEHPIFRRRGEDVLVELPLDYSELVLGADVVVPTLDGTTVIRIPPSTPPGRIFRLTGRGLPRLGSTGSGDLHYQATLEVPAELSNAERAGLRRWADALPPQRHPARAVFDRTVQER